MALLPDEVLDLGDGRVTTLARALYDEMLRAPWLREALVCVEAGVSRVSTDERTTIAAVERVLMAHRKTRGIRQARAAVAMASDRVASPGETRMRWCAEGLGMGPFLVNVPIFDPRGRLAGIADLLEQRSGLVLEYDGDGHRAADRHAADNAREERFEGLNLTVTRLMAPDLTDRATTLRLLDARRRGQSRRSTDDRWTTVPPDWWYRSWLCERYGVPPWR